MRHGFEPITIKIKSEDKRELQRRFLEHPEYGRWNGPKSYADLIREAIAQFLAPKTDTPASVAEKAKGVRAALSAARGIVDDLPFYVHRYRAGDLDIDEGESVCGLIGLQDAHTTNIAENVTCPRCKSIREANLRALAAPSKPAKKKTRSDKGGKRAPLPPGSTKRRAKR